jgi:hypothetical protein
MELLPFPRYKENPSKAFAEIKDFPSRSSDIFICASLKSGRHDMTETLNNNHSLYTHAKIQAVLKFRA